MGWDAKIQFEVLWLVSREIQERVIKLKFLLEGFPNVSITQSFLLGQSSSLLKGKLFKLISEEAGVREGKELTSVSEDCFSSSFFFFFERSFSYTCYQLYCSLILILDPGLLTFSEE